MGFRMSDHNDQIGTAFRERKPRFTTLLRAARRASLNAEIPERVESIPKGA